MTTILKSSESAIAMAAAVDWSNMTAGAEDWRQGYVEIYALLAQFADLSTEIYDAIDAVLPTGSPGVWAYEVDGEFGDYFAKHMTADTFSFDTARVALGNLVLAFFARDTESLPAVTKIVTEKCFSLPSTTPLQRDLR